MTTTMKTKLSLLTGLIIMTGSAYAQAEAGTPLVFGSTYVSGGASSNFGGDIVANTYLTVGASTQVTGDIKTGAAVTIGANSIVGVIDEVIASVDAGTAATLGANAVVTGAVKVGTALTLGAGATKGDAVSDSASDYTSGRVNDAQGYFNNLTAEEVDNRNQLPTLISVDLTLKPYNDAHFYENTNTVVYNASSLTTSAGIILTLEGNNINWVFNITDMMTLGANTKIVLADNTTGSSVTWNLGGYVSLGAGGEMIGTILAGGYVTTGAYSKVTAANVSSNTYKIIAGSVIEDESYCGGIFSATSYVTLGASATVACKQTYKIVDVILH
jgi:serine acetyltransferase